MNVLTKLEVHGCMCVCVQDKFPFYILQGRKEGRLGSFVGIQEELGVYVYAARK